MALKKTNVDLGKSTNKYPTPPTPVMMPVDTDVDFAASTGAYPMAPDAPIQVVNSVLDADGRPIDFAKSVDRYPMIGNPEGAGPDPDAAAEQRFPTPGPASHGHPDVVAEQRAKVVAPPAEPAKPRRTPGAQAKKTAAPRRGAGNRRK